LSKTNERSRLSDEFYQRIYMYGFYRKTVIDDLTMIY